MKSQKFRAGLVANVICAVLTVTLVYTTPSDAAERRLLSLSRTTSNDSVGEFKDRWRTSSLQLGFVTGPEWNGQTPLRVGEIIEFRFRADVFAPEDLRAPDPTDRRHAGILAFGPHTYWAASGFDMRAGAEVVVIGPQTGLLDLQEELHELLGFTVPDLDDFQIEDQVRGRVSTEIGRSFDFGHMRARPFVEAQAGDESLVRVGADFIFGRMGRDDLMVRSEATGQLVPSARGEGPDGFSFTAGFDIAKVFDSVYLPEDEGYELSDTRDRVRLGVQYDRDRFDLFYGITYLGTEFEAQREGQLLGTLQGRLRF